MENIEKLKILHAAYKIADEYDGVTEESPEFTENMADYIGYSTSNIVNEILDTIESL